MRVMYIFLAKAKKLTGRRQVWLAFGCAETRLFKFIFWILRVKRYDEF